MLDFLYQTGWGAFTITMIFFVPFILVGLYIVVRRAYVDSSPNGTPRSTISRVEGTWLAVVVVAFVAVNVASIAYMPTVATARAVDRGVEPQQVDVTASSWFYEMSTREIEAGRPVRFSGKSTDTMHGFAVYHPDGRVLFTMMLMPGLDEPTSLVHTFDEPGTYTVRCLEYCGLAHHEMRDEIVVVSRQN